MSARRGALPAPALTAPVDTGAVEHYQDAEFYDFEYRDRDADVAFYLERITQRGAPRVLELGCGSGRLTLPLAAAGCRVHAIDRSSTMLAQLQQKLQRWPAAIQRRVSIECADMRTFEPSRRYDVAVAAFNVFEHLYTRSDLDACLQRLRRALRRDGELWFDVQMPDIAWLSLPSHRRYSKTRYRDPRTGQRMLYSTNHEFDPVTQVSFIRMYYEPIGARGGKVVTLTQRKFFPSELELLLECNGWDVVKRFGDFAGGVLAPNCESQVICARPSVRRR